MSSCGAVTASLSLYSFGVSVFVSIYTDQHDIDAIAYIS